MAASFSCAKTWRTASFTYLSILIRKDIDNMELRKELMMSRQRFYYERNFAGGYFICDTESAIKVLPGQHYGYRKEYNAQRVVDDLNAGRETRESMYALWRAGE